VRRDRFIGPTPVRPYERHRARPVPYADHTHRGRIGYGGGKASRMTRQQLVHPPTGRHRRQRHAAHEYIGMRRQFSLFRTVSVHPQMHIAEKRAGRVRARGRTRMRVPLSGREHLVGPDKSRTVRRIRTPDDERRPVVHAVITRCPTGPYRTEAHRGPRGIRLRSREPVAHSAASRPAGISHRVRDGGREGGATNGGRAGSPSPSMR